VSKAAIPEKVTESVKRNHELKQEKERLSKAWDSVMRTAFGLMDSRKERVDLDGIERSVDQVSRLISLRLEMIQAFSANASPAPHEENGQHASKL
jgi:chemotaxis regulatin CheY-phosphate phosphatase CheZ